MPRRSVISEPLPSTMIVSQHKPHRPEHIECHSLAVVVDGNRGIFCRSKIEGNDYLVRIRVVRILDQFEDSQTRVSDQLFAEQLQYPGPRPKRLAYLT